MDNKKEILEAVKNNGMNLKNVNEVYRKDREVVLEAVKSNGFALVHVDKEEFKRDKDSRE